MRGYAVAHFISPCHRAHPTAGWRNEAANWRKGRDRERAGGAKRPGQKIRPGAQPKEHAAGRQAGGKTPPPGWAPGRNPPAPGRQRGRHRGEGPGPGGRSEARGHGERRKRAQSGKAEKANKSPEGCPPGGPRGQKERGAGGAATTRARTGKRRASEARAAPTGRHQAPPGSTPSEARPRTFLTIGPEEFGPNRQNSLEQRAGTIAVVGTFDKRCWQFRPAA